MQSPYSPWFSDLWFHFLENKILLAVRSVLWLFLLLATIFVLTRCYNPMPPELRPHVYKYHMEAFVNNRMLPPHEHWLYVHTKIDGTEYVMTKEQWAQRISGNYLVCIWVYYEKETRP